MNTCDWKWVCFRFDDIGRKVEVFRGQEWACVDLALHEKDCNLYVRYSPRRV